MTTDRLTEDRVSLVERHVGFENDHDIDGVMETFGQYASYDDEPWDEHRRGRDDVRAYYEQLMAAVPDLHIEPRPPQASNDVVVLECTITGTHLGTWHGLPGTGRPITLPLCGIYTFDDGGTLAGERIYYDRATVLQQVGVFHDPESLLGRLATALSHPLTMARIVARGVR
jgi:steroid delta-isomerase-like uncharacterized protein